MPAANSVIRHFLTQLLVFSMFINNNMADSCPQQCRCHGNQNQTVNCSGFGLASPPLTPQSTLTLNLSHNALGPIITASFVQMRNMTSIDLSYNGLTRLLGCTFSGMLELRAVWLRRNELKSLPDSLFADSNKIEVLDVSSNRLTEIPDEVLRSLPELRRLDVSNNLIGRLKLGARFQVPKQIKTLDLSHNPIQSIQSDSFAESSNWATVTPRAINLAFCRISAVEAGSFSHFPNLNNLDLSGNSLPVETIRAAVKDLESKGITRLSLTNMNLTSLEALFSEMAELPLTFLDVSFNQITDLPPNVFTNIKGLRELDISANLIPTITEGFSDLTHLNVLNISHNRLESFQGDAVLQLTNLATLDLSYNKLGDHSRVQLSPLVNLKNLNVSNNILTSAVLPSSTSNLQHLNYSFNKIAAFNAIEDAGKLTFVDFSGNNIQSLPSLLFKGARYLQVVNFSRNNITKMDHGAFLPQSSITIDLSFNFLKEIRYSNLGATQKLYIHHNELVNIDSQSFYLMNGLQELDLSFNKLSTLHEELFEHLTMLTHLNLSHNFLDNIQWFLFRSLELLKSLDLGYNNISRLNESIFFPIPVIETVSLRNNLLRNMNPSTFKNLNNIKCIDLSNNPLDCSCDALAFRDWIKKTDLNILGLYQANSSAYLCRTPHERAGLHVTQWSSAEFECDKTMLYVIVFCSTLVVLAVFTLIGVAVYRVYVNWKIRQDGIRKNLELEKERRRRAKKIEFVRLLEKKLETEGDGKKERSTGIKNETEERRNGYVAWPGETQRGGRGRTLSGRVDGEERGGGEKKRGEMKSGRGYERLRRDERAEEEFGKRRGRGSGELSHRNVEEVPQAEMRGKRDEDLGRQSEREDSVFIYSERNRGSSHARPSRYDQFVRDSRLRREHESAAYSEGYPRYNAGPYIISPAHTFPNRWDGRRGWVDSQELANHGYRISGGEESGVGRVESGARVREVFRDNGFSHHPLEVHFTNSRDPNRPTSRSGEERHQRSSYHQRSLSSNCLPQDYYGDAPFLKEEVLRGRDSRRYTRPQTVIGHRAASQPYLHNEGNSGWL